MAKKYKTQGVYAEEVSILSHSVAQVETALPAFVGYSEKAKKNAKNLLLKPTRITSLLEYETYFGKALNETNIVVTIDDEIESSGQTLINRKISVSEGHTHPFLMHYAMRMYFDNGGGPCYITSVGDYTANISLTDLTNGLNAVKAFDEPTLFVFPDAINLGTAQNYYTLINRAMMQCVKLGDRFTIIDMYGDDSVNLRESNTLGNDSDLLKFGAAYHPFLRTVYNYAFDTADVVITHNTVDESNTSGTGQFDACALSNLEVNTSASFDLMTYNQIKLEINKKTVTLPPSCAIAGIYARVDNNHGVWKAPANVSIRSCLEPTLKITNKQQEALNSDASGKSINAIRIFRGKGIIVWGARTLAGNDNEWRYVSVRRFFNMVEESVKKATARFLFESNDTNTWIKIRAMIKNFLILQWRAGALVGAKPEHAFYVKVGLGETMTSDDVLNGLMNIEIGMAVVRPAEFIIFKFSQKIQKT